MQKVIYCEILEKRKRIEGNCQALSLCLALFSLPLRSTFCEPSLSLSLFQDSHPHLFFLWRFFFSSLKPGVASSFCLRSTTVSWFESQGHLWWFFSVITLYLWWKSRKEREVKVLPLLLLEFFWTTVDHVVINRNGTSVPLFYWRNIRWLDSFLWFLAWVWHQYLW